MKKVLVLGGSGFVGKAICRELTRLGAEVYSINRSGKPLGLPEDLSHVKWIKGNALDPQTYSQLSEIDTLIHSIGILTEPKPKHSAQEATFPVTFESEIRDTLKVALDSAAHYGAPLKRIGYISAADFGALSRFLLPRYMKAKQEAETILQNQPVPTVIARPGFMYGRDRSPTIPFSYAYSLATIFAAGMFPKALDVNSVARSLVTTLADENLSGTRILEVSDL